MKPPHTSKHLLPSGKPVPKRGKRVRGVLVVKCGSCPPIRKAA